MARTKILIVIFLVIAGSVFIQSEEKDSVNVRTWNFHEFPNQFPPELHDKDLAVPWLIDRPSFGIAFSGGGTRSATATLGELRALHRLGWLSKARYLSANSGGSWAVVPYTYLSRGLNQETFLGPYISP